MSRYKPKTKKSFHAEQRFKERYVGAETVDVACSQALHYGVSVHQIPEDNPLYGYMTIRIFKQDKKIRILNGFVFVFSNSKRLITLYPLPDEYAENWESIKHIQEENRIKYRENRDRKRKYSGI